MTILNWLYWKKQQLIRTKANNADTDLIVLGAEVPFTKRDDGYQDYAMPLKNAVQSGNQANTKHYELDMIVTNTVTVNTTRGIIDIENMGTPGLIPDPAYGTSVGFLINNPDLDLTFANRDNIYVQYSVYYNQVLGDNTIPHLIATGVSAGLGFNLYNANPAVAGLTNWTGALYIYYELYTLN
tara:strand:- start:752 stop:1300 length:549 start_codon:yes stop_codon:yes gene_type:complete